MMRCFIYLMFLVITLKAGTNKPYSIESGKILYEIYGGGVFTPEVNFNIEGREELLFKAWGKEYIESMRRIESLEGTLQHMEKILSLKKRKDRTLYTVDFKNKSIIQSKLDNYKEQIDFSTMKQSGTIEIASHTCELWKGENRTLCLYKGLILLDEKNYLGFTYGKKAIEVDQNTAFLQTDFELPAYPIKKDSLFIDKVKTTQTHKEKTLSDKIISAKEYIDTSDKRYTKEMKKFSKKLFKKEKAYLFSLLNTMSKTRVCLYRAEINDDANLCLKELNQVEYKKDDEILSIWDDQIQKNILDDLDNKIVKLEAKMPCIKRSLNIIDLAECMK